MCGCETWTVKAAVQEEVNSIRDDAIKKNDPYQLDGAQNQHVSSYEISWQSWGAETEAEVGHKYFGHIEH